LSFGEENTLVRNNDTETRRLLERVASTLKFDPRLLKNVTNVSIADVVEDLTNVFGRLVTRKNVKVSQLQFLKMLVFQHLHGLQ